jgi:hypothetical protein
MGKINKNKDKKQHPPGYISLYRKLMNWRWYKKPFMVHLFIHLLLKANFRDTKYKNLIIKRGQLKTRVNIDLVKETGITQQCIRTCLKKLQLTGEIKIFPTNKFSIITVCKYEDYQLPKNKTNKQKDELTIKTGENDEKLTIKKQAVNIDNDGLSDVNDEKLTIKTGENDEKLTPYYNKDLRIIKGEGPTTKLTYCTAEEEKNAKLFSHSPISNFNFFKENIGEEYQQYDLKFYHDQIKNYAAANNLKKFDWFAFSRKWMQDDIRDKKIVMNPYFKKKKHIDPRELAFFNSPEIREGLQKWEKYLHENFGIKYTEENRNKVLKNLAGQAQHNINFGLQIIDDNIRKKNKCLI